MYGVYDTEILLAPSSINFNPQPTLSGASPTLSGASRYAVRSRPDTSARLKRRQVVQTSSVKMTLQNVILNAELLREIETCVDGVTPHSYRGQSLHELLRSETAGGS